MKRFRFVVITVVLALASPVIAAENATIIATESGRFTALVGKNLPDFVKRAAELVPKSAIPSEFGSLLDRVVVVTDVQAFAKAMGLTQVAVISVELKSKTIYVVMDRKLQSSSPEDPLTWVIRAEGEWKAARLRQVPDRGMAQLMATMLVHELEHVDHQTVDESHSNEAALTLLDSFARQGKVSPELVRGYRAVLGHQ